MLMNMTRPRTTIVAVAAPSGGGKGTVLGFIARILGIGSQVSFTDRPQGPNEQNGVHYHFVTAAEFNELQATRDFLTYGEYNGHRYGDPMPEGDRLVIIVECTIEAAIDLRRRFPETVIAWLEPPGRTLERKLEFLSRRLCGRGRDNVASIERRLARAREELTIGRNAADVCYVNRNSRITAERLFWLLVRRLVRQEMGRKLYDAHQRIWV